MGSKITNIEIDLSQYNEKVLMGLIDFSHLEVIFFMHGMNPEKIDTHARHPRNNTYWPKIGIFAQRPKARPNRIGLTRCQILKVEGYSITVQALDAIVGTPVLDIKTYLKEYRPMDQLVKSDNLIGAQN
ncbi:TrmO family methyltransferase [Bacillus salitolerans]|uniref:TrmO family methyltransferase n=1 Tax=Bacillus salitolerans TaxID=1437434 RepID=A0ABW4LQU5_9BACI